MQLRGKGSFDSAVTSLRCVTTPLRMTARNADLLGGKESCPPTFVESLDRRLLANVQVGVVGEAGDSQLVVAWNVKAKLAEA